MEVDSASSIINASIRKNSNSGSSESAVNSFGIGQANKTNVELSPQARILQQTEQTQRDNAEKFGALQPKKEEVEPAKNDTVRVTTTVGRSAQSGKLTSEQALDVYRSIEKLL